MGQLKIKKTTLYQSDFYYCLFEWQLQLVTFPNYRFLQNILGENYLCSKRFPSLAIFSCSSWTEIEWNEQRVNSMLSRQDSVIKNRYCTLLPNALDPYITAMYFKKFLITSHRRRDLYEADEEKGEDGFHGCCQWLL